MISKHSTYAATALHCLVRPLRSHARVYLAGLALAGALVVVPGTALADDELFTAASTGQSPVTAELQALEDTYNEAKESAADIKQQVEQASEEVEQLEERLAVQKTKGAEASDRLYRLDQQGYQLTETLLSSGSLRDFIKYADYLERIAASYTDEIERTRATAEELADSKENLNDLRDQSQAKLAEAKKALERARKLRVDRQERGIAQAVAEGGLLAVFDDGANWDCTRDEFIAEWETRIDAYLAGSPMEGQGHAFAAASWEYCVDPRWSPAIAHMESSKGRLCIRPYNAWGWGAADSDPYGLASEWGSWGEAIFSHVRGLSEGYGYTITLSNAQRYCSNWAHWYDVVLSQMALI